MKKLYYSIGEVSEITGIEPHVLRYWETVFDDLNPKKNSAGNRVYRNKDLKIIEQLQKLIKKKSTARKEQSKYWMVLLQLQGIRRSYRMKCAKI